MLSNQPPFAGILFENFILNKLRLTVWQGPQRRACNLASIVHFEGGKTPHRWRAPSPDRDELDTGSGLSYQLVSAQDCTISRGWTLSGQQCPAGVPRKLTSVWGGRRCGGLCPSAGLSAEKSVC